MYAQCISFFNAQATAENENAFGLPDKTSNPVIPSGGNVGYIPHNRPTG